MSLKRMLPPHSGGINRYPSLQAVILFPNPFPFDLIADVENALCASGGAGIRTLKSLRTPVFKTGALAVLPPLRRIPSFPLRESLRRRKIDM